MSIYSEIDRINGNIEDYYDSIKRAGIDTSKGENSATLKNSLYDAISVFNIFDPVDYSNEYLNRYSKKEIFETVAFPSPVSHSDEGLILADQYMPISLLKIKELIAAGNIINFGNIYRTSNGRTKLKINANIIDDEPIQIILHTRISDGTLRVYINDDDLLEETESSQYNVVHDFQVYLTRSENIIELEYEGNSYYCLGNGSIGIINNEPTGSYFLDSVYIGENCKIYNGSLKDSIKLKRCIIDPNSEIIGRESFMGCSKLNNIVIPDNILWIGEEAFQNCYSLYNISFSNGLENIENGAFECCISLKNITFSDRLTTIGDMAFRYCTNLKNVILPNTVTSIGSSAFNNCSSIESIIIPEGVTVIEDSTFNGCTSLRKVIIPNTVLEIKTYAFASAPLSDIVIPNSVTKICSYAFGNCSELSHLDMSNYEDPEVIPILENINAFERTNSKWKILVYNQAMLDAFSNANNWSQYSSRIEIK